MVFYSCTTVLTSVKLMVKRDKGVSVRDLLCDLLFSLWVCGIGCAWTGRN